MPGTRQSGQAAVETALTLPLLVFLVLGTIQLFLLLQGRLLTQYAAFQGARVGALNHGACDAIVHAALLAALPAIDAYLAPTRPGRPGEKLGEGFRRIAANVHQGETLFWVARHRPRFDGTDDPARAQRYYDLPLSAGEPTRLELRVVLWLPLRIPFADWVFSRMALAQLGLQRYTSVDPLSPTHTGWEPDAPGRRLDSEVAVELLRRVGARHYAFPVEVTATQRMLTPVRFSEFARQNCPAAPETL